MDLRSGRRGTFQQERAGETRSHRLITWVLTVFALFFGCIWFFFFSEYWLVTDVQMNDLQFLGRGEVASSTFMTINEGDWKPWPKRSILLLNEKKLAEDLRERLFAENVTVEKSYPHILRLMIQERQRSVIVAAGSQLLNVDTHGLVTGDVDGADAERARLLLNQKENASLKDKPVIETSLTEFAASGYQIAQPEAVKGWIETYKELLDAGMTFRYIRLTGPTSTSASVVSDKGFQVIVDLLGPIQPQVETYEKFMVSKPKDLKISEYVDVRIPGKIYVK